MHGRYPPATTPCSTTASVELPRRPRLRNASFEVRRHHRTGPASQQVYSDARNRVAGAARQCTDVRLSHVVAGHYRDTSTGQVTTQSALAMALAPPAAPKTVDQA